MERPVSFHSYFTETGYSAQAIFKPGLWIHWREWIQRHTYWREWTQRHKHIGGNGFKGHTHLEGINSKAHILKGEDSKVHTLEGIDSKAHILKAPGYFPFESGFRQLDVKYHKPQTLNLLPQPSNNVFEANKPQSGYFLLPFLKTTKKIK